MLCWWFGPMYKKMIISSDAHQNRNVFKTIFVVHFNLIKSIRRYNYYNFEMSSSNLQTASYCNFLGSVNFFIFANSLYCMHASRWLWCLRHTYNLLNAANKFVQNHCKCNSAKPNHKKKQIICARFDGEEKKCKKKCLPFCWRTSKSKSPL